MLFVRNSGVSVWDSSRLHLQATWKEACDDGGADRKTCRQVRLCKQYQAIDVTIDKSLVRPGTDS